MSAYLLASRIHHVAAIVLITRFIVRGVLMFADSPPLKRHWVSVVAHANDTGLLVAALYMAWAIGLQDWAVAKLVGLVMYVALAIVALKRGRTRSIRTAAFCGDLFVLAYMVAVAVSRRIVPFGD